MLTIILYLLLPIYWIGVPIMYFVICDTGQHRSTKRKLKDLGFSIIWPITLIALLQFIFKWKK